MIIRFAALFAILSVGLPSAALADDLKAAATKVSDCRSIEDDGARLACLDAAALALSLALDADQRVEPDAASMPDPAPVPIAEPEVKTPSEPKWAKAPKPRKDPAPTVAETASATDSADAKERRLPIWARVFSPGEDEEQVEIYEVTVTRITRNNLGRHFFHTSEGQVWRQTVVEPVKPPKSLPIEAKISKELMGAPSLRFKGGPKGSYRVRRVE